MWLLVLEFGQIGATSLNKLLMIICSFIQENQPNVFMRLVLSDSPNPEEIQFTII